MSDALKRIFEAAGCLTQLELAEILDVKQSSISDAKRRGTIPPEWLIKLLHLRGINPAWIMDGIGPKFLAPSDAAADANYPYETFPPVRPVMQRLCAKFCSAFLPGICKANYAEEKQITYRVVARSNVRPRDMAGRNIQR